MAVESSNTSRLIEVIRARARILGTLLLSGYAAAAAGLIGFLILASEVGEGETASFDAAVRDGLHQVASPALTQAMVLISFLGSAVFLIALGVAIAATFLIIKWRREAIVFAVTTLGESALDLTLKPFYRRPRPDPFFDYTIPQSFSFPSGHALASICFYGILAWLLTARIENRVAKIAVWIFTAILILLIGTSRVYLGVHYASDVIAGYVAGLVWLLTVTIADNIIRKRREPQ